MQSLINAFAGIFGVAAGLVIYCVFAALSFVPVLIGFWLIGHVFRAIF